MATISEKGSIAVEAEIKRVGIQKSHWDRLKRDLKRCRKPARNSQNAGWALVGMAVPLVLGVSPPPEFLPALLAPFWNGMGVALLAAGVVLLWASRRQTKEASSDVDEVLAEIKILEGQLDDDRGIDTQD